MRTVVWSHPFREAAALEETTIATELFHIALAGRGYFIDTASDQFLWESLDYMRPQQDTGDETGIGSLSNIDLWSRSFRSWHQGAGQIRGDDRRNTLDRFDSSKGVDPWTKWRLSLLHQTLLVSAGANSPAGMVTADGQAVHQSGPDLMASTDGVSWPLLTTVSSDPSTQITSDGFDMYVGCVDGTIKKIDSGGLESTAFTLADTDVVAVSKGRVWAGAVNVLYWMTPGGSPAAAHTHAWTGWRWTAITEGSRATYAAGFLGDKSEIYRVPIKDDGTGLDAATVAATLPDGEVVYSMAQYLGYILIGTSKGVRFAVADSNGDLNYGQYLPTPEPVRSFEPQDRFVWYGWSNYDSTDTGVGRVDLSVFTDDLTPAYASDLMYEGQGEVVGITTLGGKRFFAIEGVGAAGEQDDPVPSGSLQTSEVTYDLDNEKIVTLIDMSHESLDGNIAIGINVDSTGFGIVAESSVQGTTGPPSPFFLDPIRGNRFALELTLTPDVGDGPVITGVGLFARPVPPRGERFRLPLQLMDQVEGDGKYHPYRPEQEVEFLRGLIRSGSAVTLQIGAEAFNVFPANYQWLPYRQTRDKRGWTGTFIIELREVTQ